MHKGSESGWNVVHKYEISQKLHAWSSTHLSLIAMCRSPHGLELLSVPQIVGTFLGRGVFTGNDTVMYLILPPFSLLLPPPKAAGGGSESRRWQ